MCKTDLQGNGQKLAGTQKNKLTAGEKRKLIIEKGKAYAKEKGVPFKDEGMFLLIGEGKRAVQYWKKCFSSFKDLKSAIDTH